MSVTYADFAKSVEARAQAAQSVLAIHRAGARTLALSLEDLEGTDEWGQYQALAAAKLTAADAAVEGLRSALEDLVGEDLQRAQLALKEAKGRVAGMRALLAIVAEVRKEAEGA